MRGACRHVDTCSNAPRVLWGHSHGHYKPKTSSIPPRERHFDQNCPILVLQRGGERGCKTALFRQLSRPRGGNNGREAFLSCLGGLPWLPWPWGGLVWPARAPMGSPRPILAPVSTGEQRWAEMSGSYTLFENLSSPLPLLCSTNRSNRSAVIALYTLYCNTKCVTDTVVTILSQYLI